MYISMCHYFHIWGNNLQGNKVGYFVEKNTFKELRFWLRYACSGHKTIIPYKRW